MRLRDRPRKRRAPQGGRPRLVADAPARTPPEQRLKTIYDGVAGADRGARAGCARAGGVVRRRRRPHRALRRTGARRRARRRRERRPPVRRVRARDGQAVGLRRPPRRQGAGGADGEGDPRPRRAAAAEPRGRRARGRDLPRARVAAATRRRPSGRSLFTGAPGGRAPVEPACLAWRVPAEGRAVWSVRSAAIRPRRPASCSAVDSLVLEVERPTMPCSSSAGSATK